MPLHETPWQGFQWMNPRPAGMSDSDSDGDDDLYELGVMTDEELRTSTMSATEYG